MLNLRETFKELLVFKMLVVFQYIPEEDSTSLKTNLTSFLKFSSWMSHHWLMDFHTQTCSRYSWPWCCCSKPSLSSLFVTEVNWNSWCNGHMKSWRFPFAKNQLKKPPSFSLTPSPRSSYPTKCSTHSFDRDGCAQLNWQSRREETSISAM